MIVCGPGPTPGSASAPARSTSSDSRLPPPIPSPPPISYSKPTYPYWRGGASTRPAPPCPSAARAPRSRISGWGERLPLSSRRWSVHTRSPVCGGRCSPAQVTKKNIKEAQAEEEKKSNGIYGDGW